MNIFSDSVNPSFNCKRRSNRSDRESDFKKTIVNYSVLSRHFFLQKRPFPKVVFFSENWISFNGLSGLHQLYERIVRSKRQTSIQNNLCIRSWLLYSTKYYRESINAFSREDVLTFLGTLLKKFKLINEFHY